MLWHDEQVYDGEGFQIVIHQQKIGIVAGGQTLAFGMKLPSRIFAPNLPFWLFNSNSSLQAVQKKSASGLLLGNEDIFAFQQCGQ